MSAQWVVCRHKDGARLADSLREDDLGSLAHVKKALNLAFPGTVWDGLSGRWSDKKTSVCFVLPDSPRTRSISFTVIESAVAPEIALGAKFRQLATKRFWAVFDLQSEQRVQFPGPTRRTGKLPPRGLEHISVKDAPRDTAQMCVRYVEWLNGEFLSDLFERITKDALPVSGGINWGIGESASVITLANGRSLIGLAFKPNFAFLDSTLASIAPEERAVGKLLGERLVLTNCNPVQIVAGLTCYRYGRR